MLYLFVVNKADRFYLIFRDFGLDTQAKLFYPSLTEFRTTNNNHM